MSMQVKGRPIEKKAAAATSTTIIAGYIVAIIFSLWPSLRDKIPQDLQIQLPVMIAGVLSGIAAYFAQHTFRPDLETIKPDSISAAEVVSELRRLLGQRPTGNTHGGSDISVAPQTFASGGPIPPPMPPEASPQPYPGTGVTP